MVTGVLPCIRLTTAVILVYMLRPLATHKVTDGRVTVAAETERDFATSSYRSDNDENSYTRFTGEGRLPISINDVADRKWIQTSNDSYQSNVSATDSWYRRDQPHNGTRPENASAAVDDNDLYATTSGPTALETSTIDGAASSRGVSDEPTDVDDWKTAVSPTTQMTSADLSAWSTANVDDGRRGRITGLRVREEMARKPSYNDSVGGYNPEEIRHQLSTHAAPPSGGNTSLLTIEDAATIDDETSPTYYLSDSDDDIDPPLGTTVETTTDDESRTDRRSRDGTTSSAVGILTSEQPGPIADNGISTTKRSQRHQQQIADTTADGGRVDNAVGLNNIQPTPQRGLLELVLPPHRHTVMPGRRYK